MTDTTPTITPEAVAAILKDVTPGPWYFFRGADDADKALFGVTADCGDVCKMSNAYEWRGRQTVANARLIAWARNNIEALAAELAAQKARADAEEAKVAKLLEVSTRMVAAVVMECDFDKHSPEFVRRYAAARAAIAEAQE